jgi:endonuclease/exonuclease/phosphatase family metal-dependent hydrolase
MDKRRLRILSYNIHKGFSAGGRRFILEAIREAIRIVHADLVFLQEVHGHHHDKINGSQFEYLADQLWPHFAYGKNAVYTSGHHGNAILSKYPFSTWENIDISTNRLEKRGLLHGTIEVPHYSEPIHAICVHLGLLEAERQNQIVALATRIQEMVPPSAPLVIGGDFNDWRRKATAPLRERLHIQEVFLETQGAHARTFPSWLPALPLDRIYYRGFHARSAHCFSGRPWSNLSDHAALYAELDLRSA